MKDNEMQAVIEANKLRAELREAQDLLRKVCSPHQWECAVLSFRRVNRYLPLTHPNWKHTPACTCLSGRIQAFLKKFEQ